MNKKQKILIVDDEAINIRLLIEALSDIPNYQIIATKDPYDGLKKAKDANNRPDIILLDIQMPELNGYEFCSEIKKNKDTEEIPIIFITAMQDAESEAFGLEQGAVDYITKPFTPQVVKARVKSQLDLKNFRDQLNSKVIQKTEALHRSQEDLEQERIVRGQLEEKVQRGKKMEAIGTMTSKLAHDFNNILLPINCYTEMAMMSIEDKGIKDSLQQVLIGVNRAKDLIEQVRSMGRSNTITEQNITRNFINLENVVDEVKILLSPMLPQNIKIEMKLEAKSLIMGNTTQLHQVIMNLAKNAVHAMEESGGVLTFYLNDEYVSLETGKAMGLESGDYIHLKIEDTGSGIKEKLMDKIFDPFFTTKSKDKGTGLGLSIVHGIIQSHKGDIFVKSKIGVGTIFDIFIPSIKKSEQEGI